MIYNDDMSWYVMIYDDIDCIDDTNDIADIDDTDDMHGNCRYMNFSQT